uniref:Potassium/sodium hyperpolarization-activated cyclic nucleotide-gated channel 1-like n=1 Tax=Cynoglossus semilaevis TaxID=244447 RepID=A0A3P8VIU7_CYNSE
GWRALLLPQINRQSLYIYGSEVAVEKECIRQLKSRIFVIHYYIMCMVAITFLNLIGLPMEIAFLDATSGLAWEGFNVFSDTLFLIDVGLNFRMGIIAEDMEQEAILDLKRIRLNYLRTWFVPDVIAAFPIGYILLFAQDLQYHSEDNPTKTNKVMRILMFVRIISLIRLARVSRLVRFFNEVEKVSNANLEVVRLAFRVLSLFMMIFLLCHWNGCIQYFVPMLEEFPEDCWVRKENLMNATVIEKYSWGVFRALSQMIALSYGSMDAPTYVEMWIVMVSMISGCLMYTVLVANATAMIANVDPASKEYKSKMSRLEHYMTFMKLPPELQLRITNYYQARYGGKWFDDRDILDTVSSALKEQIMLVMCSHLLRKAPMFQGYDDSFIRAVLSQLDYKHFQEGDVIAHQYVPGDRMFFIEHGQVLMESDSEEKELCDGDFFG